MTNKFQVEIKMQNLSHKGKPPEGQQLALSLPFVVARQQIFLSESRRTTPAKHVHQEQTSEYLAKLFSDIGHSSDDTYELVASFTGKNPLNP
jgi:hypothetical protein